MGVRVCNVSGCPKIYEGTASKCELHRKSADKRRGTATERGYTGRGHRSFRNEVLERDEICVLCHAAAANVADHYPISRRDLVDAGMDPDDPNAGRGLCHRCHSIETAVNQPGGWADRS